MPTDAGYEVVARYLAHFMLYILCNKTHDNAFQMTDLCSDKHSRICSQL